MSITKSGRKKLFRLTTQRKIMLSNIIATIADKIELEEGFGRRLMARIEDEGERNKRLMESETNLSRLKTYHDVLQTVASHEHDFHLACFVRKRGSGETSGRFRLNSAMKQSKRSVLFC
ncbi:hypothetical protein PP175_29145 (plasmid) [Aneurinibacillus sp. Ricciae_BoGa-3]|uniref:hypothetical protein n=1 Tax=Aneurinibacillus sp. Ricciae_BoGa-3 TaxID=3022697 RepID=UPI002341FEC6|nr:hypothetical protein [Aneurinibacillus sp. Ricciae_BoGa-3]WCK57259.1 hypothetical protein PP175_29145 [Aneurinibacillus sp. Ricciae_BoGa-3]